jgi:hypothetical protein
MQQAPKDPRFKNLLNLTFNKLTVFEYDGKERRGRKILHYWKCECDCGNTARVEGYSLRSGNTQSCGCLQREKSSSQKIDLVGKKFDRLMVLEYTGCSRPDRSKKKNHQWLCLCDCGNEAIVLGDNLRNGLTRSCGCLQKERASKSKIKMRIDLTGQTFGKLTVLKYDGVREQKNRIYHHWLCECECGNTKSINGSSLRRGLSKSCGCKQGNFTHGMWGKPGYKAYYLKDPVKKLKHIVGSAVRDALTRRKSSKNGGRTFDHLPYTPQQLKEHLEEQFEPWMTWENYGGKNDSPQKTWQIDHIKPQNSYSFTSMDDAEFQECWALENLRPLEKIDNMGRPKK